MDFKELLKNLGLGDGSLLSSLSGDAIALIASLLNVEPKTLSAIIKILPPLLNGELDLKSLLPTVLPVMISYLLSLNLPKVKPPPQNKESGREDRAYDNGLGEYAEAVKKEFSSLELYLQSASAS